jgi:hypothetical protein
VFTEKVESYKNVVPERLRKKLGDLDLKIRDGQPPKVPPKVKPLALQAIESLLIPPRKNFI